MNVIEKYDLELKKVKIGGIELSLYQTCNLDKYFDTIDSIEFGKDERFPYFVNIWQSGLTLSEYFVNEFPKNKISNNNFLELGCGTGITGLVISYLGGKVTFSDFEEDSLKLCKENSIINKIDKINTLYADWRDFPELNEHFHYIVGSDLLYEKRFVNPLVKTTEYLINKKSVFILSDPCRNYYSEYLLIMEEKGFKVEMLKDIFINKNQKVKIFQISLK